MQELNILIDKASHIAGTRYKLAQALKVTPATVYGWQRGKPCPPGDIALMAAIAGLDPVQWLVRATLEKYEGTEKGDQLARALGKPSPTTSGANDGGGATEHPARITRAFFCPGPSQPPDRTSHPMGTRWH